jgi:hypothetical protein
MNAGPIRPWARILNIAFAVALAEFVLANYWPIVKVFDLARGPVAVDLEQHRPCSGNQDTRQGAIGK